MCLTMPCSQRQQCADAVAEDVKQGPYLKRGRVALEVVDPQTVDLTEQIAGQEPLYEVRMMNKLLTLMLLFTIGGLSGCNTIEGAGKDIQSGGEAVSESARDVKKDM